MEMNNDIIVVRKAMQIFSVLFTAKSGVPLLASVEVLL